jgi:N-sulfoglucosamine sulfohydrolase
MKSYCNMKRRDFLRHAGLAALTGHYLLAPGRVHSAKSKLNVLFIVTEDMGPTLGCYGDKNARTPNMDKLAEEGVRFENAFVTQASCSPSRSSILTGLYPHQNGQIALAHYSYSMSPGIPNIPTLMKQAGYHTGIMGKLHVNPAADFPFDETLMSHGATRRVKNVPGAVRKFLDNTGDKPFFLYLNFSDAHTPLKNQIDGVPEKPIKPEDLEIWPCLGIDHPDIRKRMAGYYNCATRADLGIGLVLEELQKAGLEDETLVIFIGDHGPAFTRCKTTCYESGLRIPFIVRWPGHAPKKKVRRELVSTVDILPTILSACGVSLPPGLAGQSVLPLLSKGKKNWRETLCAEYTAHVPEKYFPMRSIRDKRYKLIHNLLDSGNPSLDSDGCPAYIISQSGVVTDPVIKKMYEAFKHPPLEELYDLKNDPAEQVNLAGQEKYSSIQKRLREQLLAWRKETDDPLLDPAELKALTKLHDDLIANKKAKMEKAQKDGKKLGGRQVRRLRQINPIYKKSR